MIFVEMNKYSFLFLSLTILFLYSCGGGGNNSDQTPNPINTNIDQNTEVNNSTEDTVSPSPVKASIVENRFG